MKAAILTRWAFLLIAALFLSGCAISDPVVNADIKTIRTALQTKGSKKTRDFDYQFQTRAINRSWPTAFNVISSEYESTIYISSGLRQLLNHLAEISIVRDEIGANFDECRVLYANAVLLARARAARSRKAVPLTALNISQGADAKLNFSPKQLLSRISRCAKFALHFPVASSHHTRRDAMASQYLQFIYLHESAHRIYHNWIDAGTNYGLKSKEERRTAFRDNRKLEIDADTFAAQRWVEVNSDPMQIVNNFVYIDWQRAMAGKSCKNDWDRTHPSGDLRAMLLVKSLKRFAIAAGKYNVNEPLKARIERFIDATEKMAADEKCPDL